MPEIVMGKIVNNQQEYPLKVHTERRQIFVGNQQIDLSLFNKIKGNIVWLSDNHRIATEKLFSDVADAVVENVAVVSLPEPVVAAARPVASVDYPTAAEDVIAVTNIKPLSLAKFFALAALVADLFFAALMFVAFLVFKSALSDTAIIFAVMLPVVGFATGYVTALLYNVLQKPLGGIKFTTD